MRMLFLVTEGRYFLSHRLFLARKLKALGHEIWVGTMGDLPDSALEVYGFRPIKIPFNRSSLNPTADLRAARSVIQICREIQPDAIWAVSLKPIWVTALASWGLSSPKIVNLVTGLGYLFSRDDFMAQILQKLIYFVLRALGASRSVFIFQNPDDLELFVRNGVAVRDQSYLVAGSGVDTVKFAPTKGESSTWTKFVVLFPSRMIRFKGVYELVEVVQELRNEGHSVEAWLAGRLDPENPSSVSRDEIRTWEQNGAVKWLDHISDMAALYEKADAVVLPSYYREGIPLALIEAASCGKPIVTTDTPGCREIVRDRVNGLLIPPKSKDALKKALLILMENSELRLKMGTAGRKMVEEKFSQEMVCEAMIKAYYDNRLN